MLVNPLRPTAALCDVAEGPTCPDGTSRRLVHSSTLDSSAFTRYARSRVTSRCHPRGHTTPPKKVAPLNTVFPEKAAPRNQVSPEKVVPSNQASSEKAAWPNLACPKMAAAVNLACGVRKLSCSG